MELEESIQGTVSNYTSSELSKYVPNNDDRNGIDTSFNRAQWYRIVAKLTETLYQMPKLKRQLNSRLLTLNINTIYIKSFINYGRVYQCVWL